MRSCGPSSRGWISRRSLSLSPPELAQAQKPPLFSSRMEPSLGAYTTVSSSRRERVVASTLVGGGGANWGLRALRMLTAAAPPRGFSRSLDSFGWDERTEVVPGKGDAVRVVVTGGLARGGDAPGGRDARDEEREEVKGTSFAVSEEWLDSEGRTCQWSSSDEGAGGCESREAVLGRSW